MAFNINDFRSNLTSEVHKPSHYEVVIYGGPQDVSFTPFKCHRASVPERSLGTAERKTYGPIRKIAYGSVFNDINLGFISSSDMSERTKFEQWQQKIINDETGDVSYYDSYKAEIMVVLYDPDGKLVEGFKLFEAYPVQVGAIELGWEMTNQYSQFDVTFAYRYWEMI